MVEQAFGILFLAALAAPVLTVIGGFLVLAVTSKSRTRRTVVTRPTPVHA
jgi:hypothetical protein